MTGYSAFAQYYDLLTENVDYSKLADYLLEILRKIGHKPGLSLDLACGTGSLTLELYRRGVDIYGVDSSVEMLSEAKNKCAQAGFDILFLCQKMQSLDLFGTVDTVFCTLDSLNHLDSIEELGKTFEKVSFFMNPGGVFIFDMNTLHKHEKVLGNNTFVYDMPGLYCVWQNRQGRAKGRVNITLDFFERTENLYRRSSEHFSETAFSDEEVGKLLSASGFSDIREFDAMGFSPPMPESERIVYAAVKCKA